MKRFFVTTLLTLTLCATSIFNSNIDAFNVNTTASAATVSASTIKAGTPTLAVLSRTATTVALKTGNVTGAGGYKVYRATSLNGTYKYIGYTRSTTYTDKKVKSNTAYYYKVRAYRTIKGVKYNSKYSKKVSVTPTMSKPSYISANAGSSSSISVAWSGVSGARSYNVYRATSYNGSYKYIGNTTCNSYTDNNLSSGKTYYYRVRSAKKVSGTKYFGLYSKKVSATTTGSQSSTPAPTSTPTPTPSQTPSGNASDTQTYDSSFASQVLKIVNEERAKEGLSALTISQSLVAPANKRAQEISQSFSHTRPNGTAWSTVLDEYNVSVQAAGENLAYGYSTPEAVMNGWMNSPGHRANIMSPNFNHVGIGYYKVNGTVYATQLFSN